MVTTPENTAAGVLSHATEASYLMGRITQRLSDLCEKAKDDQANQSRYEDVAIEFVDDLRAIVAKFED